MSPKHHLRPGTVLLSTMVALTSFHCFKPAEPVAPRWDVNLTMPLTNRTYSMEELLEKDTSLLGVVPGSTVFMYKTTVAADPTYVGDKIAMTPLNIGAHPRLGPFGLSDVTLGLPVTLPGVVPGVPIPPATGLSIDSVAGTIPGFQQAFLKSGVVGLRIRNTYPAPLTFEGPIYLRDASDNIVASFVFSPPAVSAGGEVSSFADLSDKTVTSRMKLTGFRLSTPGSGGVPVQSGNTLQATLEVTDLIAHSAVLSQIPPQVLVDNAVTHLPFNDSTIAREVLVKSGTMTLQFSSNVNISMFFRFRLEQVFRPGGITYSDSVSLPARGSGQKTIDLAGWTIRSLDGSLLRGFDVVSSVNLYEGSRGQAVFVAESDSVNVSFVSSTLVADSVVAVIKPTRIAVDETVPLDLGDLAGKFHGQLTIPGATLRFSPLTSIICPMQLDLQFEAMDAQGRTTAVLVAPSNKAGTGREVIDFNPQDVGTFLSRISGALPEAIRVVGSVIVNQNYDISQPASIGSRSSFGGSVELGIPLSLAIQSGSFADTGMVADTTGDGRRDARIDQEVLNKANWGRLHVDVDNGLPLDVRLKLRLLDRSKRPLFDLPQGVADTIRVFSGVLSGGDVLTPTMSRIQFDLTPAEIRRFNEVDLVALAVAVNTPGAGVVNFRSTDRIRVRAWMELSEQVNP